MGSLGMMAPAPCVSDKVKLKTAQRVLIMRNKKACRLLGLSSLPHCPEPTGPRQAKDHLHRCRLMETHQTSVHADPKLDHMAPNRLAT